MTDLLELTTQYPVTGQKVGSDTNTKAITATRKKINPILNFRNNVSDGQIGAFKQQSTGDCYLLASLISISKTKAGAAILKNNIKRNKNGNYTVTLPGAIEVRKDYARDNKQCYVTGSYTITKEEIAQARKNSKKYASGDIDVLIYELAFEKYRKEVLKTNKINGQHSVQDMAGQYTGHGTFAQPLEAGTTNDAIFILTGNKSKSYKVPASSVASISSESIKSIDVSDGRLSQMGAERYLDLMNKDPDRFAITFSLKLDNGRGKHGYHALALSRVDDERVYFINPWNSKKEFSLTKEEFIRSAYNITVSDFGRSNFSETIINQTYNACGAIIDPFNIIVNCIKTNIQSNKK